MPVFTGTITAFPISTSQLYQNAAEQTRDPFGTDDFTAGYSLGMRWIRTDTNKEWVCTGNGTWTETTATGTGDVVGPASATDNAIARYDTTTGKLIQDSGITIADGVSAAITGSTGTGNLVLASSPALTTPNIGTPSAGVLTNCTGLPTGGLLDDAVTLAKMASGTAGNLISYDASGNPAAVATGTATHVLTSNGAGLPPTFQAAAGSLTIGDAISGGTANRLLYEDSSKKLAESSNLTFDGTEFELTGNFLSNRGTSATNLFLGDNAGNATATGLNNVFLGANAGNVLTTGGGNFCLGTSSGLALTEGNFNVLVGQQSGDSITTGDDNVAIGRLALSSLVTSNQNTAVGTNSLAATTSLGNTGVGYGSGSTTTGLYGTFVGGNTNTSTTGISRCIALGRGAIVTASNQFACGSDSAWINDHFWGRGVSSTSAGTHTVAFYATSASGSNANAADFNICAGRPTGSGDPGILKLQAAIANGGSATTLGAVRDGITIDANTTAVLLALYHGTTPVAQAAAMTSQETTITFTEPGTPDYALQDVTNSSPYGFVDADELRTFIGVVENLQVRVAELEAGLSAGGGGIGVFA